MRLVVFSHKLCWPSPDSPSGYATDGGFPFQMRALSELFSETVLAVPCSGKGSREGEIPLEGQGLRVTPLSLPSGTDLRRKLAMPLWLLRNGPLLLRETLRADAVHAPIPGDVGTLGMLLALALGKPLFVRYCGNWTMQTTTAERCWKWLMERSAGGKRVMLATGGAAEAPSPRNPAIRWIFSTSLTERELEACRSPRRAPEGGRVRLIIVCRQEHGKGTGTVIESLPLLQGELPGVALDVVGDGRALPDLKAQAERLGVADRVEFHGKVDHHQVIRLLQDADLFCFPTRSEGFPKGVLEALACGLPVITTPVSVLPQLVGNGSGLLLDRATPEAVAQAVRECISPGERYEAMSARAVETATQYSLERWRDSIGALLRAAWGDPSVGCVISPP
jgi:hypothetical protein